MNPHLLKLGSLFVIPCQLNLQLSNPLGKPLVHLFEVSPEMLMLCVSQMSEIGLIERLEVMKESLHHILVKVVVRKELCHCHKDRVAPFGCQLRRYLSLLLFRILFYTLEHSNPLKVLLLRDHQPEERPIEDSLTYLMDSDCLHVWGLQG